MSKALASQVAALVEVVDDLAALISDDPDLDRLSDLQFVRAGLVISRARAALGKLFKELEVALAPRKPWKAFRPTKAERATARPPDTPTPPDQAEPPGRPSRAKKKLVKRF